MAAVFQGGKSHEGFEDCGVRGMSFGHTLKNVRREAGISRKTLAEVLGMTVSSYSYYERDEREPPFKKLCKIADVLDVSLDELFSRKKGGNYAEKYFALKEKIEKLLEEE